MFLLTERLYHENMLDFKRYDEKMNIFGYESRMVGPAYELVANLMKATIKLSQAERSSEYLRDNSNEGFDTTIPLDYVGF